MQILTFRKHTWSRIHVEIFIKLISCPQHQILWRIPFICWKHTFQLSCLSYACYTLRLLLYPGTEAHTATGSTIIGKRLLLPTKQKSVCVPACMHARVCVCVCVREWQKIELTVWGKKVSIPLDGLRTCTSGIRAHRASDYTTRVAPPRVSRSVCVGVCVRACVTYSNRFYLNVVHVLISSDYQSISFSSSNCHTPDSDTYF